MDQFSRDLSGIIRPSQQIPVDAEIIETPQGKKTRFNVCLWGISNGLLDIIADKVADKVMERIEKSLQSRGVERHESAGYIEQNIPDGMRT